MTTYTERSATSVAIEAELLAIAADGTSGARARELKKLGLVGEVPHGTGAALARKHGVSRERVRQIAVRARVQTERVVSQYTCRGCHKPTRAYGRFCGSCAEPAPSEPMSVLECEGCGTVFERARRKVAANAKQAIGRGRPVQVFCTPACAGRAFGRSLTARS